VHDAAQHGSRWTDAWAPQLSTYFAELPSSAGNGEVLRTIMGEHQRKTTSSLAVTDASHLPAWRKHSVAEMCERHHALTAEFLADANGTPATPYLAPTTGVMYTYVRQTLGVPLAGREHFAGFKGAAGQLGENNGAQVVSWQCRASLAQQLMLRPAAVEDLPRHPQRRGEP
jgi:hypothetical protein